MRVRSKIAVALVMAGSVVFALAGADVATAAEVDSAFTDDDWSIHETAINAIAAEGITKGCNPPENSQFCPNRSVSRGEMAAFIVRAFELGGPTEAPFVDTNGHLFEADIAKLAATGITVGCLEPAAMMYCPDRSVSRAEMATFLMRALELEPIATGPFDDIGTTVHRTSINAIAAVGITRGCNPPDNTRFCPFLPVTRAEMATFLKRSLGLPDVLSRVALAEGASCNEELTVCLSSITIPTGRSFIVREGWYQALPASTAELAAFEASGTRFTLELDGTPVASVLGTADTGSQAQRSWESKIGSLSPGTHTLVGTWSWNGDVNLIATVTITSS